MRTRAEQKQSAKDALKGNWGKAILVWFITGIVAAMAGGIPYVGFLSFLVTIPLSIGMIIWFIALNNGEDPSVGVMWNGFKSYGLSLATMLLVGLFTLLWLLLLIIPGIIKALSYAMAPYIIAENPQMRALDAITESREMMRGHKLDLFVLQLSFIGWSLLCMLTLGIGYLWLGPYIQATMVNFYNDVKNTNRDAELV